MHVACIHSPLHYPLICHDLPLTQTFFDYHDLPLTQLPFLITIDYSLDYNLNLVNNYCSWPNIGQVPTPQGTDLYLLFFFFRRQHSRVVSTLELRSGGPRFESCSHHLLDLFSVKSRVQILSHACK